MRFSINQSEKFLTISPRSYVIWPSVPLNIIYPLILIHSIILSLPSVHCTLNNIQPSEQGPLLSQFLLPGMNLLHIIQVANSYITFKSWFKYSILFPSLTASPFLYNGTLYLVCSPSCSLLNILYSLLPLPLDNTLHKLLLFTAIISV